MAGIINGGKEYTEQFEVRGFECNRRREFSVASALKYIEHGADKHLSAFNMSYSQLLEMNTVFLLSAIDLRIRRPALMNEILTLATWHRKINKARYIRDAVIMDKNGENIIECIENWFLVDPVSHRIKRPREFPEVSAVPSQPEKALEGEIISIDMPDNMQKTAVRRVMYSDVDYNRHLNNTKYAEWTADYIPGGIGNRYIINLKVLFHSEAFEGEDIDIYTLERVDTVYVRGVHSRGKCFEAEAVLS